MNTRACETCCADTHWRHDVKCITHVHTDAGMAVACSEEGLRTDNFYSALLQNRVAYHDFEGITVMDDEKPRLIANMGDKNMLILRNNKSRMSSQKPSQRSSRSTVEFCSGMCVCPAFKSLAAAVAACAQVAYF